MATSEVAPPPPLVEDSADIEWETTLRRDAFDVEIWLDYAEDKARRGLPPASQAMMYERALAKLPGSYKIWYKYLSARRGWITFDPAVQNSLVLDLNSTFERALMYMNKMPRIWLMYCEFLVEQRAITAARRTFDRALGYLPPSQHHLIWNAYSKFALSIPEVPAKTSERVLRRHAQFDPEEGRTALVEFLKSRSLFKEAVREYKVTLDAAKEEDVKKDIRTELFALARSHAEQCRSAVDFHGIICTISKSDQDGRDERVKLFEMLAEHHLQLGEFDRAREIYESTMLNECDTVKNFATVFEAYSRFEEAILDAAEDDKVETDFRSKRMRDLLDRRTRISSELFLKAWTGDIQERLKLCEYLQQHNKPNEAEALVIEAFPEKEPLELYNGRGSLLFAFLADEKAKRGSMKDREKFLELGCKLCWDLKDVVELWRMRIELALEEDDHSKALKLARAALTPPPSNNGKDESSHRRPNPHRSYQLWSVYLDLEESYGTLESARAAYEQALELRVSSVWMILNYCKLLRKNDFHEDSYSVFERAIAAFPWPHVKDLWVEYLRRFVERYQGTKVERARDLFEQCIDSIPESHRQQSDFVFLSYAKFEEEFGLSRRAIQVYERWSQFVPDKSKYDAFLIWAAKCEQLFGAPQARKVYETAVGSLPELDVARICVRFADVERRLGELDRARAIFKHGSQFSDPADPKKDTGLWQAWNDFEVKYGDEESFKEMLRVKRSVQAHYSVLHAANPQTIIAASAPPNATEPASAEVATTDDVQDKFVNPDEIGIDD